MRKYKLTMWVVASLFVILAAGCGGGHGSSDSTPTVTLVNPIDLATDVAINRKIVVTFSEEMDPLSITSGTFTIEQGTTPVIGTVEYTGTTATFTPESDLAVNTIYTATITTGANSTTKTTTGDIGLAGNAMSGGNAFGAATSTSGGNGLAENYVWTFTTGTISDVVAPMVTGTINANGAINVAVNTNVGATFSEGMDPMTITNVTFTLEAPVGTPILGTVSYSGVSAVFIPLNDLAPNTLHTVTIKGGTDGVHDLAGIAMASDFVLSWTTSANADTTAPTVTGTVNANGSANVAINTNIGVTFSEGMDPLTITNVTFMLESPVGTPILGTVSFSGVNAVFMPLSNLAPNTLHTCTIKGGTDGVYDLAGNALANDFVWTWTTSAAIDTIALAVTGTINLNNATNVPVNGSVGATFNEGMDPLTINNLTFLLESPVGTPVPGTVSFSGVNAVFIPLSDLTPNTLYTVTIKGGANGVKDLAGNPMASDFVLSWTTGSAIDSAAPLMTGTINANGATDVAINTDIGATFSEGMDPLTITNLTFIVEAPVGTPVSGTVSYTGVNALFIPLSDLAPNTLHTVTIKGGVNGVKDLAGNPMVSDFVLSWTTGAIADTVAPMVTGTINANGAINVPINTHVGATFSEGMDPLTFTTVTYKVEAPIGTPVHGTLSYTGVNALFIPLSDLASSTLYTVTIKGGVNGVKDLAGNPMASDFVLSWTTGAAADITAPTVFFVNPADTATDVPFNQKIAATFSEAMNPLTLTTAIFTVEGSVPVTGTIVYAGTTATFTPMSDLEGDTTYTATIGIEAKDSAGNALESAFIWSFTTGTTPDTLQPTVSFVSPADAVTDVPLNSTVTATFSEPMDPLTITTVVFTVDGAAPVNGTITYAGTTATFAPVSDLTANTAYTATITTVATDLAGNPMASDYTWSFTTGSEVILLLPVVLGQTSHFAVIGGYAVTTVPASAITGDVGISPAAESFITGFSQTDWTGYATSPQVTGNIYAADMASPTPAMLTQAKGDLTIAYNDAAARTPVPTGPFLNPGAGNLAGLNLVPGLYKFTGEAIATTDFTLTGGANDVWIFQIASTLIISNGVHVTLAGGAQEKNIFWKVGTQATLGTTVIFYGTIMAEASVTMNTGSTLYGRALAFSGTVALDQATIVVPLP